MPALVVDCLERSRRCDCRSWRELFETEVVLTSSEAVVEAVSAVIEVLSNGESFCPVGYID